MTGATARLLALQRTAGNRAVTRLLQRKPVRGSRPTTIRSCAPASIMPHRCGGEVHEGCACADTSVDAGRTAERAAHRRAATTGPTTPVGAGGGAATPAGGTGATSPMTPEAFARHMQEVSGLQFLSDPGAVVNAARNWVSAGYQPW
ncbi:MAG TPA: hypothetical protein VKB57_25415 [Acidimicrobiales bacterium]|nr:hypothetical protein [Acidimicrobiales bacterium]